MFPPEPILKWPLPAPAPPGGMTPGGSCRVCVADGQTLFRTGLAVLLDDLPGVMVVSQARDCTELFGEALAHEPDLLFLDLLLPGLHARPQLLAIRHVLPNTRVILLVNDHDAQQVRSASELDVDGVLPRTAGRDPLEQMIAALRKGQRVPRLLPSAGHEPPTRLTRRELQILQQMACGLSNAGIGHQMCIALPTVKFHVTHILGKLGVDNRTAAVVKAMRIGLVLQADGKGLPPG